MTKASSMLELRLYLAQRISAAIIAPLVLIHLGMMIYAIQGGLDAAEILGRTRGSFWWAANYGLFVIAVAVHAAIGLRPALCLTLFARSHISRARMMISSMLTTNAVHLITSFWGR